MSLTSEAPVMRVYLVRHGETQENREGIIQGHIDTKLNAMGMEQARLLGEALKEVKFDCAFSSDLQRAVNTAEAILKHHPGIEIVQHREIRERAMGDLEGTEGGKWTNRVVGADTSVETSSAFAMRLTKWWNERILQVPRTNVLVATHGGVIMTLVQQLLGSRKIECGPGVVVWKCMNASVSVIEVVGRKGVLVSYGSVSHLEGMEVLEAGADQANV